MRAFITGVTGFAGGYLAEHLLASGDDVLGCSNTGAWPHWASEDLRRQVGLVAWDVSRMEGLSNEDLARIVAFGPDCIYHLAAVSVPDDCGRNRPTPRASAINVDGTAHVLELAASLGPAPRVLFVSTSHVYAPPGPGRITLSEQDPVGPRRGYGITKLAAEEKLHLLARDLGLDTLIVRAFQHTGPRQGSRMMLPEWATQFARPTLEPVRVRNRQVGVDLSDVRDVVRAYRLLIRAGQSGAIYNLGSGVNRRSGDVLDLLARLSPPPRPIHESESTHRQDPIADIGRLVACTGWQPAIALERTVADTLDYWRQRELHYAQAGEGRAPAASNRRADSAAIPYKA